MSDKSYSKKHGQQQEEKTDSLVVLTQKEYLTLTDVMNKVAKFAELCFYCLSILVAIGGLILFYVIQYIY